MPKKEEAKEPEAKAEEKPKAPKQSTPEEIQGNIIRDMGFAAGLAEAYKKCKEAGLTAPSTDLKMKELVNSTIRNMFGWPPEQPAYPPAAPAIAPPAYPPTTAQPAPTSGQPVVPARTYPGQPPRQ